MILLTLFSSIIGFSNEQLLLLHLFQHDMDMTGSMHDMFDSGSGTSDDMNMSNIIYDKRVRPVRNFEEFEDALDHILNDKNFRNNLVNKATTFVNSRLNNQGNASITLSNYVHNMK